MTKLYNPDYFKIQCLLDDLLLYCIWENIGQQKIKFLVAVTKIILILIGNYLLLLIDLIFFMCERISVSINCNIFTIETDYLLLKWPS